MNLHEFLETSYTAYQAVKNAANALKDAGFLELSERETWKLKEGGKYFVVRGGSSLVAFRYSKNGAYKIVASHTDSPCLKLKENPAVSDDNFTRLNTEPYGGGLWYTFFDRPLKLAGRVVKDADGALVAENFVSDFQIVLPSLAIHQNREANEKFAPNLQTELPLLSLGKADFDALLGADTLAYDLFAVPDIEPFESGASNELISSPRLDDLAGAYSAVQAIFETPSSSDTVQVCACLEAEEIGSRTYAGAAADFLRRTLERIAAAFHAYDGKVYARSILVSLDNAHALHPNHPEKCDPTNRPVPGKGIVIKAHAGGAYTSDGMTIAIIKTVFDIAEAPCQTFYNRSDVRSGSTLGAISLAQVSIPSVDIGLAQLAMHSAVETMAKSDLDTLKKGLIGFYGCDVTYQDDTATVIFDN